MSSLKIVPHPHPALRWKSKEVKRIDAELKAMVAQMFELMYEARALDWLLTRSLCRIGCLSSIRQVISALRRKNSSSSTRKLFAATAVKRAKRDASVCQV